jgi:hypothetical protein
VIKYSGVHIPLISRIVSLVVLRVFLAEVASSPSSHWQALSVKTLLLLRATLSFDRVLFLKKVTLLARSVDNFVIEFLGRSLRINLLLGKSCTLASSSRFSFA